MDGERVVGVKLLREDLSLAQSTTATATALCSFPSPQLYSLKRTPFELEPQKTTNV